MAKYRTIDICEGYSGKNCLMRYYKKQEKKNYLIYSLGMNLSIGDIKYNHIKYLKNFYQDNNYDYFVALDEIINKATKDTKIRVWSSKENDDEYMLFLFICHFFQNSKNKISVIFVSNHTTACSINALDYTEINSLLKYEKNLSEKEIKQFANEWNNLSNINSELRVLENNTITCKKYSDYYENVLNILKEKAPCKIVNLITECMIDRIINDSGDLLYLHIIDQLINVNKIKVISKGITHMTDLIDIN